MRANAELEYSYILMRCRVLRAHMRNGKHLAALAEVKRIVELIARFCDDVHVKPIGLRVFEDADAMTDELVRVAEAAHPILAGSAAFMVRENLERALKTEGSDG